MLRDLQRLLDAIDAGHPLHDRTNDRARFVMEQVCSFHDRA